MDLDVKHKPTETLISKLTSVSEQTRITALCELRLLTKSDPDIRPIIAQFDHGAAITLLSETLYSATQIAQENAAATLLNISISCKQALISSHGVLDSIAFVLSNHRTVPPQAVQSAAATIYSFTVEEKYRPIVGCRREIVYGLIDIVGLVGSPSRSIKDGVKALFGLALCGVNRPLLVEFGAVEVLVGVVIRDGRLGVVEDVTAVIAQIAGCEESVGVFRKCKGVRVLVDLIMTGPSLRVKENGVFGLLNLVKVGGEVVVEEIREVGFGLVFDGLREVVQCGSDKGKKRAQALMEILEDEMSRSGDYSGSDLYSGPSLNTSSSYSYSY